MLISGRSIVIDPSSAHYCDNKLFDLSDSKLNRDGTLLPFQRMQYSLQSNNIAINTVDLLLQGQIQANKSQYISLGMLSNLTELEARSDIEFKAFLIMEPPIVAPELYGALPYLATLFEEVYVHNTIGDGYSLDGVDQSRLRKLYWPQPYQGVIDKYWNNTDRLNRIVVINGNHKPRSRNGELYSKRIEAMAALAKFDVVDLYGRGWGRWWSRSSLWIPYWLNRNQIMSIYKGECISKYEVLTKYKFCLCFENMEMTGYVSEKIFDCLYAGTIPLYWGAPDIDLLIPPEAYVDVRKFSSWKGMWLKVNSMSADEIHHMRCAGEKFLKSDSYLNYSNSLQNILRQY